MELSTSWKQGNKAVYRKSNSVKDALFQPNKAAKHYANKLLTSMDASERREAIIAPKIFLDTHIHEFMHHYDYEVRKFPTSLHTTGFYYRRRDVMKKLIGQETISNY